MSVLAAVPVAVSGTASRPHAASWLVGPWFDLFFIANIAWPLLFLVQAWDADASAGLTFWQLYFITTPHRWITLALVFLDRGRFEQRRGIFLSLAIAAIVLCLGIRFSTGALTCLLTVDYLWNAWHFSAQHHGVYRIYGRLADPSPSSWLSVEKWIMRVFLLYVILRVASATWADAEIDARLRMVDLFVAPLPLFLLLRLLASPRKGHAGSVMYLLSVCLLFGSMLWAVHTRQVGLVLALATASALFHAVEYLAIVTWSVRRRHDSAANEMGTFAAFVPRWGVALAVFIAVLGLGGYLLDSRGMEIWLVLNVIAAFLHYAYDGLIWRQGRAATS